MSTAESQPNPSGEKLPKKRNPVERLIVWGGILGLLAMLAYEWNTKNQYEASVNALEAAVTAKDEDLLHVGISANDIPKYLKGTPKRSEEVATGIVISDAPAKKDETRVVYEWPSLFKTYKVGITVDQKGKAYFVEAITSSSGKESDDKPAIKLKANPGASSATQPAATSPDKKADESTPETSKAQPTTKLDSPIEPKTEPSDASAKEN